MPQPITITIDNPDPAACPTSFGAMVNLFRTLFSAEVPDPFTPYVVQAATPAVNQQSYIWYKLDANGRPLGVYKYYSSIWRKVYTGNPEEMRLFRGNPADHFISVDPNKGLGILGGEWDGWHIANGQNGTHNLSDRFIVVGDLNGAAYGSGDWRTSLVTPASELGGAVSITTDENSTFRPARAAVTVGRFEATGNMPNPVGNLYSNAIPASTVLLPADDGNLTPTPIITLPPFYALAICEWVGYE